MILTIPKRHNEIKINKVGLLVIVFFGVARKYNAGVFSFKDTLLTRMNDLNRDLVNYSHDNTRTSVGARLAMYEVGLKTYNL